MVHEIGRQASSDFAHAHSRVPQELIAVDTNEIESDMTRYTMMIIRNNPDFTKESGEGIKCDAAGPDENGNWSGWVSLWRDRRPHISPLISTPSIHATAEAALREIIGIIKNIREMER